MQKIGIIKNKTIYRNIKIKDKLLKDLPIDFLIKIAILTVMAGYEKTNKIFLFEEKSLFRKKSLENFLSFLLNDRDFAPIRFKIKILNYFSDLKISSKKEDKKLRHNYDSVILFSGGFDTCSVLLYALDCGWNPLLLWIGFGQKNESAEEKATKKIAKKLNRKLVIIKLDLKDYIEKGWKDWSYIVPGRNFMFAVFGAAILAQSRYRTNSIIMGVTKEEYYHSDPCVDKSPHFFKYCSNLFSKFYKKDIKLISPLKSVTKAELVAHWKNYWSKKYKIDPHETTSCYFGINCGVCNSCFKRNIAFLTGGIELDKDLNKNPFKNKRFVEIYIKRCFQKVGNKTKFSHKRAIETLIAYKKAINYLPNGVKKIINNLAPKLQKEILREEERLNTFTRKPKNCPRLVKKKSGGILYIARHGETEYNRLGLLMGRKDIGLNENGIKQAHELGKKAKKININIDFILSSSMIRARQTAEIVKSYIRKPIKIDSRLIERDIGVYEGLTMKEVEEKFQKGYDSDMAYRKTPPGGESTQDVQKRVFAVIEDLKKQYPDKKILIITHSFIIRMINKYFHPAISAEDFFKPTLKNVEFKKFKF